MGCSQRAGVVDLARELLELNVDVLASHTTEAIAAIRSLNTTIPVVMTAISDPIGNGLVASLARPGGNTTGVTLFSNELAGKRLQVLKEVVPQLTRVALLAERDRPPTATLVSETQAAAHALRLALQTFEVRPEGIAEAFRSIEQERADAVIVQQNLSFTPICGRSPTSQSVTACLPSIRRGSSSKPAGSWPTDQAYLRWGSARPGMSTGFSRGRNQPIFRSSNRPSSS